MTGDGVAMLWALSRTAERGDKVADRFRKFLTEAALKGKAREAAWEILLNLHAHLDHDESCPFPMQIWDELMDITMNDLFLHANKQRTD